MRKNEVFVVGYCRGRAGFGIYWGPGDAMNRSSLVTGGKNTQPCAELEGAIMALNMARTHGYRRIQVNMKSKYVVSLFTTRNKVRQNWQLVQDLCKAKRNINVFWKFVDKASRAGGIEEADKLAREAVGGSN